MNVCVTLEIMYIGGRILVACPVAPEALLITLTFIHRN